ncbi:MAG: type II secretion system protein [Planctomycetaceae bacterium]
MYPTRPIPERTRSAFTLIEVLLALTIIVVMSALAWTPLLRSWGDHRLQAATQDVRNVLAGTRIFSLDNDAVWQFRYEPGGDHFVRIPYQQGTADSQTESDINGRMSLTLPEGLTFGEDDSLTTDSLTTTGLEPLTATDVEGLPDSGELTGLSWSRPILFYPDGTATETTLQVVDDEVGELIVNVRELTGGVTVTSDNLDQEL